MRHAHLLAAALLAPIVALSGCSHDATPAPDVEVMASGLDAPWGLAFLPDGDALVGERDTARLYRLPADGGTPELIATVPGVVPGGEGGLLGIALDPLFKHSGHSFVYAYLTSATDNRIVRFNLDPSGTGLYNLEVVLDGIHKASTDDGGALTFGPDRMLYAGTGDAGQPELAQRPDSLNGKILRMDPRGQPPAVDPNPEAGSLVWSTGYRDVQGLAWDRKGRLFATDRGQDTWDEVNLVEPGKDYGWPVVEGAGDNGEYAGYADPLVAWHPDAAGPAGIAVRDGVLYVACLTGERLYALPLTRGGTPGAGKALLQSAYGRLRNVQQAPDGSLWVITGNRDEGADPATDDDRVLRLAHPERLT